MGFFTKLLDMIAEDVASDKSQPGAHSSQFIPNPNPPKPQPKPEHTEEEAVALDLIDDLRGDAIDAEGIELERLELQIRSVNHLVERSKKKTKELRQFDAETKRKVDLYDEIVKVKQRNWGAYGVDREGFTEDLIRLLERYS